MALLKSQNYILLYGVLLFGFLVVGEQVGYYYGESDKCGNSTLHHFIDEKGTDWTNESSQVLSKIIYNYQHCGVVVLRDLITNDIVSVIESEHRLNSSRLYSSRSRLRRSVTSIMRSRQHPDSLLNINSVVNDYSNSDYPVVKGPHPLCEEYLHAWNAGVRERNDGRIDFTLFGSLKSYVLRHVAQNLHLKSVLKKLLGSDMELKSVHIVDALPADDGCRDQHWHRDQALLFEPDNDFHLFGSNDVHAKSGGLHMPSYAINVFIPLVDFSADNGPTEFTLGSHQWASTWLDNEDEDYKLYGKLRDERMLVGKGSAIIADYRTVHRGTINRSTQPRPLLMLIFGRKWWHDRTNYDPVKSTPLPATLRSTAQLAFDQCKIQNQADDDIRHEHQIAGVGNLDSWITTTGTATSEHSEYAVNGACCSTEKFYENSVETVYTVFRNLAQKWSSSIMEDIVHGKCPQSQS